MEDRCVGQDIRTVCHVLQVSTLNVPPASKFACVDIGFINGLKLAVAGKYYSINASFGLFPLVRSSLCSSSACCNVHVLHTIDVESVDVSTTHFSFKLKCACLFIIHYYIHHSLFIMTILYSLLYPLFIIIHYYYYRPRVHNFRSFWKALFTQLKFIK